MNGPTPQPQDPPTIPKNYVEWRKKMDDDEVNRQIMRLISIRHHKYRYGVRQIGRG